MTRFAAPTRNSAKAALVEAITKMQARNFNAFFIGLARLERLVRQIRIPILNTRRELLFVLFRTAADEPVYALCRCLIIVTWLPVSL